MVLTSFEQLIEKLQGHVARRRIAVAAAGEAHTIDAVIRAADDGLVDPVLVGDEDAIRSALLEVGAASVPIIYHEGDPQKACEKAVALVKCGEADFLMKGNVDTKVILKAVVDKEKGLGTGRLMSHFTIFEIPAYHKLLAAVDGGMVTYPTVEQKKEIILNTTAALHALGYERPKVGILACVEKLNPKMIETVEADALAQMAERGELGACVVAGPISYDLAVSREAADIKNYTHPVAGDADILIAPNIHAGNIMGKMLTCTAGARLAGCIVGAECPIVLTSRASSADEKYMSIVLSAVMAGNDSRQEGDIDG